MTNPLDMGGYVGPKSFAGMVPGETRTVTFTPKDKEPITKTITRTTRPFLFDWHDASNEELARKGSRYRWVPEFEGESFKLVDKKFITDPNAPKWRPSPEEFEQIHRNMAAMAERSKAA